MRFSPSVGAFYPADWKYASLPDDLIELSEGDYDLISQRPPGYGFTVGEDGIVSLVPPPPDPEPSAPGSVSPAQARLALLAAGLLAQVEAIVAAADVPTQIAWNNASVIERNSPTVAALSGALGLTDAQLDDLFTTAAAIRV